MLQLIHTRKGRKKEMKTTKKQIMQFATSVNAIDLTNADSEEVNNIRKSDDIKEVTYAVGTYGLIAWLGVGKSGRYYYIHARNTNLFIVM